MYHTGRLDITATALEPLVHGAGTSGNSQLLRMQDWIYIEGGKAIRCRVPMISGNSIKHRLRAAAVQYALDAMDVEDRSLTKPEVDLLFSGGHLNKSGAAVDLTAARALSELFPVLSLCGYSAGNAMEESKLKVHHLHVVCRENADRVPDRLRDHPMLALRAGALCVEEFGTRHDQATKAVGRRLLADGVQATTAKKKAKALTEASPAERGDSAQMIYNFGSIMAGAVLWGAVDFADLTPLEREALRSAFFYAATDRRGDDLVMGVGAKNSIGYGAIRVELAGSVRVGPPRFVADTAITASADSDAAVYQQHLRERKDEILGAIRAAVA